MYLVFVRGGYKTFLLPEYQRYIILGPRLKARGGVFSLLFLSLGYGFVRASMGVEGLYELKGKQRVVSDLIDEFR